MADEQPIQGKQEGEKQFSLKPIEQQMLQAFEQQYFTTLSNFLSYLSMERFAYTVTQHTKFRVEKDQVYISEASPEEIAANEAAQKAAQEAANPNTKIETA